MRGRLAFHELPWVDSLRLWARPSDGKDHCSSVTSCAWNRQISPQRSCAQPHQTRFRRAAAMSLTASENLRGCYNVMRPTMASIRLRFRDSQRFASRHLATSLCMPCTNRRSASLPRVPNACSCVMRSIATTPRGFWSLRRTCQSALKSRMLRGTGRIYASGSTLTQPRFRRWCSSCSQCPQRARQHVGASTSVASTRACWMQRFA